MRKTNQKQELTTDEFKLMIWKNFQEIRAALAEKKEALLQNLKAERGQLGPRTT